MPQVSVLMAVYNGERYLRQAIESVLYQTFSDWEFVIVDDGSTDSSVAILNEYAQKDSRFKIITNPKNIGLTRSLNLGLARCVGQYLARLDADDLCAPERLAKQVDYLNKHAEIAICGSQGWYISSSGQQIGEKNLALSPQKIKDKLLYNNQLIHSAWLARADILNKIGRYNSKFTYSQDYELLLRLSGAGYGIANLPERLISWRVRPGSLSWGGKRQEGWALLARILAIARYGFPKWSGLSIIFIRLGWFLIPQKFKFKRYAK